MNDKRVCEECGWRGVHEEVLVAENPFSANERVHGCPKCKSVDSMLCVCDREGCWEPPSCGVNTERGYENLCSRHAPWGDLA